MRDLLKILGIFFFGLLTANVLIRGECEEQAEDNALDSGCSTSKKTEQRKGCERRNNREEKHHLFLFPLYTFDAYRLIKTAVSTVSASSTIPFTRISGFSVISGVIRGIIGRIIKCFIYSPLSK